jgi:hypothetical protein
VVILESITTEGPNDLSGYFMRTVNETDEQLSIAECSEHGQIPEEADCILRPVCNSFSLHYPADPERSHQVSARITTQQTPYSIVLLEKLTDAHGVKKFPAFYKFIFFITTFTAAHHWSYAQSDEFSFISSHSISIHQI